MIHLEKGYVLRYVGVNIGRRAKEGVGIVLSEEMEKRVESWEAVNSRLISIRIKLEEYITVVQVYAPTDDSDIVDKEAFYAQLQRIVDKENDEGRQVVIMGDFNGRTGDNMARSHGCMGLYGGEKITNENGKRLIEFCIENQMLIGNSLFQHKTIHKITYEAEGREAKSIIDYFIYPSALRYAFMDVKVIRGAEIGSDHRLLVAITRIQKFRKEKSKRYEKIQVKKLSDPENKNLYKELIEQKMSTLEIEDDMEINDMWQKFKDGIIEVATEVCGKTTMNFKKKCTNWWTEEVKAKVKEKKEAWRKYLRSKEEIDRINYIQKRNESC